MEDEHAKASTDLNRLHIALSEMKKGAAENNTQTQTKAQNIHSPKTKVHLWNF